MEKPPILITLTAPTCAGKSFLLNHIRDEGLLCLISTTTRPARKHEIDGVDYYFISDEQSKRYEERGEFIELVTYRDVRYGVTKSEFENKMVGGMPTFLIVEPSGIGQYAEPVKSAGALWLKYYIHTDPEVRLERFKTRAFNDLQLAIKSDIDGRWANNKTEKTLNAYFDRFKAMLTEEYRWGDFTKWDRILFGEKSPEENLSINQRDVQKAIDHFNELNKVEA